MELVMDPTGDNSELKADVEQQREKIGQLTFVIVLLARQLSGINQLRNDPPLQLATERDCSDDAKLPQCEVPRAEKDKVKKERKSILEMREKWKK